MGYVCDSVPFVFVSRVTDANIIWLNLPFSFFTFYVNSLFFDRAIRYFGLQVHAARLISALVFCCLPCFDLCGHYSPMFVVRGQNTYASLSSPRHIITFNFVVLFEEFTVNSVCFGDPGGFIGCLCIFN